MRFIGICLFRSVIAEREGFVHIRTEFMQRLACSWKEGRNTVIVVEAETSLFIVASHSCHDSHIAKIRFTSYTEFFSLFSLNFLHLCLLPTASNSREHYDILIFSCFQSLLSVLWFSLLRVFLSPKFFFAAISEEPDFLQSMATAAASCWWLDKFPLSPPSYSHLMRNSFTRSTFQ